MKITPEKLFEGIHSWTDFETRLQGYSKKEKGDAFEKNQSMHVLKIWRFAGIIAIIVLGSFLHYVYSWTNHSAMIAWMAPVNESLWEHLKLGYWSVVLFSCLEYLSVKNRVRNYFLAKLAGILALEMTVIVVYYGYTWIAGRDIFWLDIGAYILGAVLCQYLTYFLFTRQEYGSKVNRVSLAVFLGVGVILAITTYYPPHTAIFQDNNNHTYGIYPEK